MAIQGHLGRVSRRSLISYAFGWLLLLGGSERHIPDMQLSMPAIGMAAASPTTESTCADPKPGEVACMGLLRTDSGTPTLSFITHADDVTTPLPLQPKGYGPADLRRAYNIPLGGFGQTVAVIDAYDDPKAESDLAVYRAQYGLPVCSTENGCFYKVAQDGTTNYPPTNASWAGEVSLDLDMVSALCPECHILLIDANTATLKDMLLSVNRAAMYHPISVSNSYGGPEFPQETAVEGFYNHPGIIMTASAGDNGFGVEFPASSQYVVAVGGTQLTPSSDNPRGFVESTWSKTGSGCSAFEPKPAWQHDTACRNRTVNDIAFDASQNSPVAVYQSYCGGSVCGWIQYAGTSIGAPAIAAIFAVAGNADQISAPQSLYTAKSLSFHDITSGSNGPCNTSDLCNARPGYDAPSGNGSPAGLDAF